MLIAFSGAPFLSSATFQGLRMSSLRQNCRSATESRDAFLLEKIREQLAANLQLGFTPQVTVEAGIVTLKGVAKSFYQKQLWLHGVKRVSDGLPIRDEIEVSL